jgi:hypothetical protein
MQRHAHANAGRAAVIIFRGGAHFGGETAARLKRALSAAPYFGLAIAAVFALAGCSRNTGSFDVDDPTQVKVANLMALVQFKPLPKQPKPTDPLVCPEIKILDGTSADRVYAPGSEQSNETVRYQFSIDDVARDCQVSGAQVAMKVGVAGRVLLGPAGSPGAFPAPIRVAIININTETPVVSKLYQVPTSVPDGQTEAPFTLVTDPLTVPVTGQHFALDYTIKVGFDSAGNGKKQPQAETASSDSSAGTTASSDTTPRHGRHHHRNFGGDNSSSQD